MGMFQVIPMYEYSRKVLYGMILTLINRGILGGYMDQVISNLKAKEIIYKKSIEILKKYIVDKYPEASEAYRAQVFADAVHKIIDDHIREFRRSDQRVIKAKLLRTTATKENFEIFAYDIMKTCVSLEIDEESFVDNMTSWINRQQDIPVYRHEYLEIAEVVKEEIASEARAVAAEENRTSAATESELLAQLEEAFGYQPFYENEEDAPLLYTQGLVNKAYEDEIRKDLEKEAQASRQHQGSAPEAPVEAQQVIEKKEVALEVGGAETSLTHMDLEESLQDQDANVHDQEKVSDGTTATEIDSQVERPVIKVSRDPEPYFSDWPEEEAPDLGRVGLMDEIRAALAGQDMTKLVSIGVLTIVGFVMIIWLLVQLTTGNLGGSEDQILPEEETRSLQELPISQDRDRGSLIDQSLVVSSDTEPSKEIDPSHLHESIQYKAIDQRALQSFFLRNDQLIGEEPYFSTVVEVAKEYGVNPLLLFAITGQEQHFVPKDHEFAELMINNPFNVYGSWETFNTDLKESTQIAARTILTASEDRSDDVDPVEWINKTYAEDKNWATGVNLIFEHLEAIAGQ